MDLAGQVTVGTEHTLTDLQRGAWGVGRGASSTADELANMKCKTNFAAVTLKN